MTEGEIMTKPKRILFATDFSEASQPAFREAISASRDTGAELVIAHAYQLPNLGIPQAASPDVYEDWNRRIREHTEAQLHALVEKAGREGIRASALVLFGDADEVLVEAAKERAVDLLIIGTHGRRGVPRLFLGSVASRVIATAPCPVLTVRGK
jgi:nucleotide-binding universal stress UspA family protein